MRHIQYWEVMIFLCLTLSNNVYTGSVVYWISAPAKCSVSQLSSPTEHMDATNLGKFKIKERRKCREASDFDFVYKNPEMSEDI